jgi:hypothetical protein
MSKRHRTFYNCIKIKASTWKRKWSLDLKDNLKNGKLFTGYINDKELITRIFKGNENINYNVLTHQQTRNK